MHHEIVWSARQGETQRKVPKLSATEDLWSVGCESEHGCQWLNWRWLKSVVRAEIPRPSMKRMYEERLNADIFRHVCGTITAL